MSSSWEGQAGDAFFKSSGLKEHLFVVLYDPKTYPEDGFGKRLCIVSVNFTSVGDSKYYDSSCVIENGEHEFIKQKSYAYYKVMQLEDHEHIVKCVNLGPYRPAKSVSENLLKKLRDGLEISPSAPRKYKNKFKEQ